ncbi:MAG: hypothetical protein V4610_22255 [Pseudomonadota bacterium]|jgi:hypothetical protein
MILATLIAVAAQPNGERLSAGSACYAIMRDTSVIGATWQSVRPAEVAGEQAWDIVVHQRVGTTFDLRDHFVLARKDLRPIAFDNRKLGKEHVTLRYANGRITGSRMEKEGVVPVDLATPAQVWEGNLWGLTFGALPLAQGGEYALPFYQYDKGFGTFTLKVTGSDIVETPGGKVDAWTVDVATGADRLVTYLIGKTNGAELGTRAPGFSTRLGGDCSGLE